MNVLHVLNYGWPYIDGYTARSIGLTTAQRRHLDGVEINVATSPFTPLAQSVDERFRTDAWNPGQQIRAVRHRGGEPLGPHAWERAALGLAPRTAARFEAELESVIRRTRTDLVHVHHPHYVADVALRVAGRLGLPAVYELRCFNGNYDLGTGSPYRTLRGRWQNALEFALARDASAVVTIGDGLAERLRREGVADENLFVVRNSVDTERFAPSPAATRAPSWADRLAARAAADRGAAEDGAPLPLHVGYATTFERMENLDTAVEAALAAHATLRERGVELTLTLAGNGRDWPRIAALVEARGAGDRIRLPGHLSYADMPAFYRGLDLFLVPRGAHVVAMDTTPLKPLEALACGLPLLVTDLPAMRELLAAREDVRFCATDADSMARGLVDFATTPWRGTGEISARAWSSEVTRYHAVYERARANGPPRASGRRRAVTASRALAARAGRGARELTGRAARALGSGTPARGGAAPRRHAVVCGFPRTGSTLLQLMVECCVPDVRTFAGEVEALDVGDALAPSGRLLSKYPDDVFAIERIAAHHARAEDGRRAEFVLMVRDPRDVLTSRHAAYAADRGYYVDLARFVATWQAIRVARGRDDAFVLRYEDLVGDPDALERRFAERLGWRASLPFARFHERAAARERDSMTDGALGGLRPLEGSGVARWRDPVHRERLASLLRGGPGQAGGQAGEWTEGRTTALAAACIDLGYETDEAWTRDYLDDDRAGTPDDTRDGHGTHDPDIVGRASTASAGAGAAHG